MTVRYNLEEEPRQLERHVSKDLLNSRYSAAALGGSGSRMVVALASGRHMFFHAVGEGSGKQLESVGAAHGSAGAAILSMQVRCVTSGSGSSTSSKSIYCCSGFWSLINGFFKFCTHRYTHVFLGAHVFRPFPDSLGVKGGQAVGHNGGRRLAC